MKIKQREIKYKSFINRKINFKSLKVNNYFKFKIKNPITLISNKSKFNKEFSFKSKIILKEV